MSKHRDHGADMPIPARFAYVDTAGNLYRVGYQPYGRVYRAEYHLDNRTVVNGEPFERSA